MWEIGSDSECGKEGSAEPSASSLRGPLTPRCGGSGLILSVGRKEGRKEGRAHSEQPHRAADTEVGEFGSEAERGKEGRVG